MATADRLNTLGCVLSVGATCHEPKSHQDWSRACFWQQLQRRCQQRGNETCEEHRFCLGSCDRPGDGCQRHWDVERQESAFLGQRQGLWLRQQVGLSQQQREQQLQQLRLLLVALRSARRLVYLPSWRAHRQSCRLLRQPVGVKYQDR
jgi:hypothetical protein